ncbi:hypothetical protein [Nostoc sp.]|uniref:hypothetical protein n=1 Tax=Nostoc sp. TaxID=1180 RepID=UPI002FF78761
MPDILLSDIGTPKVDVLRQLRMLPSEQGGQIRAMPTAVNYALTAYAREINEKEVLRAGFYKHLAKPVEPANLIPE